MNWNKEISEATSALSVVAMANNFVAELARKDLTGVPAGCIPGYIETAEDVDRWHAKLAAAYCRPEAPGDPVVRFQDLVVFFMNASARLATLAEQGVSSARAPPSQPGRTGT